MLIEADISGLEVVAAAWLSGDRVLRNEIKDGISVHDENQKRFNFPTKLVAKTFMFRLIYGGTKFSYPRDPEFSWISTSEEYWQEVIDEYYRKYYGLQEWHSRIVMEAMKTGRLVMPTGRTYTYTPYMKKGEMVWPRTAILNYPVQGLGADLVALGRVRARRMIPNNILFVMTVHDSLKLDIDNKPELCYNIITTMEEAFSLVPRDFTKRFGVKFDLPLKVEVKYGNNWKDMKKYSGKEEDFYDDFDYFRAQAGKSTQHSSSGVL